MADLNILGMISGQAPGYARACDIDAQKMAVLLMVSGRDTGRDYGGDFSIVSGEANDPDVMMSELSSTVDETVRWMKENDDSVPLGFTASVKALSADADRVTMTIVAGDGTRVSPYVIAMNR